MPACDTVRLSSSGGYNNVSVSIVTGPTGPFLGLWLPSLDLKRF